MATSPDTAIRSRSMLVDFDADGAVDAVDGVAGDSMGLCAEYNVRSYNVLYLDPVVQARFESLDELFEVGDDLHTTMSVDVVQRELFDDYHPALGEVRAFVTFFEGGVFVRVLLGTEGLFVGLEPDAPVTRVVEAVEAAIADGAE